MNFENLITPKCDINNTENTSDQLSFLDKLSSEQQLAVTYKDNNQIITAGAGSGKTRVLTFKIAYLISTGVSPSNILALTFTNKAANEMKSRIVELLDNKSINELWMGTFHSIFLRILRENHEYVKEKFKLNQHFLIYDQKSKNTILEMIIEKYIVDYKIAKQNNDRKKLQEILFEISDDISKIKNEGKNIDDFLNDNENVLNSYSKGNIKSIYKDYIKKCRNSNAIDFDDILLFTYRMLYDNEEIAKKYKNLFKYILIDEYQDTNTIQFKIIELIHGKNCKICVVGDEAQSIYSFRGSKIENIQKFREKYSPLEYKLSVNYRSTKTIVEASNQLIKENEGQSSKELISNFNQSKLIDSKIKIISSLDERDEARIVADKIIELRNKNKIENNWGSFAILYRTHKQAEPFETQLKNCGIPYKIVGKIQFLDREIIVHIISYLRVLINEKDNISLQKIFSFSFSEISLKMKKIFDKADKIKELYWTSINALDSSKDTDYKKVEKFLKFIILLKKQINKEEPNYFIEQIVEFIKQNQNMFSISFNEEDKQLISLLKNMTEFLTNRYYQNMTIKYIDYSEEEEEEDIKESKFKNLNDDFDNDFYFNSEHNNKEYSDKKKAVIAKYSLKDFLDDLILLNTFEDITENIENLNNNPESEITQNIPDKVKLMTIHSSKGLEFNTVFIVGVEEGYYPVINSRIKEENKQKHVEEERRMFYVAITRAKQNCFISYVQRRLMGSGNVMTRKKSRFIDELGEKSLDFTEDIVNNSNNGQVFSFNRQSFNESFNNNINSYYKYNYSKSNNSNFNKKNDNYFKKSKSFSFLNKKRYNNYKDN